MFVASNLLLALAQVLGLALNAYFWVVLIAVVMTWFSPDPFNPLVVFFRRATEPVFGFFRRRLPVVVGAVDLSPWVVMILIYFLESFLVRTLADTASRLK
jgi:YggT family protein